MAKRPKVIQSASIPSMWHREDVPDLTRRAGPVIVAGSAQNNSEEVAEALRLRPDAPIFGASGGGSAHPGVFHVVCRDRQGYGYGYVRNLLQNCVSLAGDRPWRYHASMFNDNHRKRLMMIFAKPDAPVPAEAAEWWVVDYWWNVLHPPGGTSLMTTVWVCAELGYDEIIVAGAPQDGTGGHRFWSADHEGGQFYYGQDSEYVREHVAMKRDAWKAAAPMFAGKLRGMSGLLREMFGPPLIRQRVNLMRSA